METSHLHKFIKFQMKSSDHTIFGWKHFGAIAMETQQGRIFELLLTFFSKPIAVYRSIDCSKYNITKFT